VRKGDFISNSPPPGGNGGSGGGGIYSVGGSTPGITTRYLGFGVAQASELNAQFPATRAGTLRNFHLNVVTNSYDQPVPVTVRVNGVPTAIVIVLAAGSTGVFSSGLTVPVAVGVLISIEVNATGVTTGSSFMIGSIELG